MKRQTCHPGPFESIFCLRVSTSQRWFRVAFVSIALLLISYGFASFCSSPDHRVHEKRSGSLSPHYHTVTDRDIHSSQKVFAPLIATLTIYCHALTIDDTSSAFDLLDGDLQHLLTKQIFVAQLHQQVFHHQGISSCQMIHFIDLFHEKNANTGIVLSYKDGSHDKLALALVKEDQRWKILYVSFICTLPSGTQDPYAGPYCNVISPQVLFPQSCSKQGNNVGAE